MSHHDDPGSTSCELLGGNQQRKLPLLLLEAREAEQGSEQWGESLTTSHPSSDLAGPLQPCSSPVGWIEVVNAPVAFAHHVAWRTKQELPMLCPVAGDFTLEWSGACAFVPGVLGFSGRTGVSPVCQTALACFSRSSASRSDAVQGQPQLSRLGQRLCSPWAKLKVAAFYAWAVGSSPPSLSCWSLVVTVPPLATVHQRRSVQVQVVSLRFQLVIQSRVNWLAWSWERGWGWGKSMCSELAHIGQIKLWGCGQVGLPARQLPHLQNGNNDLSKLPTRPSLSVGLSPSFMKTTSFINPKNKIIKYHFVFS